MRLQSSQQLRKERGYYQHYYSYEKHCDCLTAAAFPFLEDYSPYIGEHHIQSHKDTPCKCQQYGGFRKEPLAEGKAEELAIPKGAGDNAEDKVVEPHALLA